LKTAKFRIIVKQIYPILTACLLAALMGACMPPMEPPKPVEESPQAIMEKAIRPPRRQTPEDLTPISTIQPQMAMENQFPYENNEFSIQVVNEPMGNVLLALAQAANLNLILSKDVDRNEPVSIKINKLPLKTALDNLLSVHDYYYEIRDGILRIQALKTAIFHIDYPLVYNNPKSETGGDILGGQSGGGGSSSGMSSVSSSSLTGEFTIEVEVEDEEHLDIWKQVEAALQPRGGNQAGGAILTSDAKVQINRMSGVIVVTDRPSGLELVEDFIDRINRSLRRQVIIEAKIVEVILDKGHEWGVNWNYVQQKFLDDTIFAAYQSLSPGANAFKIGLVDNTGTQTGEVLLDALATQGNVNMLSSPRLNVLNNQSALISVGRIIPYIDYQVVTSEGETQGGGAITNIQSVPVIARTLEGITLGITPQISADGVATLHIVPIITEQTGSRTISVSQNTTYTEDDQTQNNENDTTDDGGSGNENNNSTSVNVPVFSIRESDTMVSVKNNETIVIGGLISESTKDNVRKVPILGDIPYLGMLFTHQERLTIKNELVILLTTTVVTQ